MSDVIIIPNNNGPYHVKGKFKIMTDGGREIAVRWRRDLALPVRAVGEQAVLRRLTQKGRLQEQPGREVVTATAIGE